MPRLILFNKPYGVLSQFTDRGTDTGGTTRPTLSNFIDVPSVYPAGRLDRASAGLLLLTDDGGLPARIANPPFRLPATYLAPDHGAAAAHGFPHRGPGVPHKARSDRRPVRK